MTKYFSKYDNYKVVYQFENGSQTFITYKTLEEAKEAVNTWFKVFRNITHAKIEEVSEYTGNTLEELEVIENDNFRI